MFLKGSITHDMKTSITHTLKEYMKPAITGVFGVHITDDLKTSKMDDIIIKSSKEATDVMKSCKESKI